jgi:hypothetical protein
LELAKQSVLDNGEQVQKNGKLLQDMDVISSYELENQGPMEGRVLVQKEPSLYKKFELKNRTRASLMEGIAKVLKKDPTAIEAVYCLRDSTEVEKDKDLEDAEEFEPFIVKIDGKFLGY